MWIVDRAQIEHRRLPTFALGVTNPQRDSGRVVYSPITLAWPNRKSAALLAHVTWPEVDGSILVGDTIFDNIIDGSSTEFDMDSSMESIWTVPWNPYGIVHRFTV